MRLRIQYAFTLIELLVVIAIVGILSGLIVVGMSSSVKSANIAKAQIFSASLRDSLLMSLASEWKFDGPTTANNPATSNDVLDTWGTYNCTIYGAPVVYSGSSCIYGSCLKFNGAGDYLACGGPSLNDNVTLSAWFNASNANPEQIVITKWNYQALDISLLGNQLRGAVVTNDGATSHWYSGAGGTLNNNTWYLGTITFKSSIGGILYLNGTKVATIATDGYPLRSLVTSGWIGRNNYTPEHYFAGLIDETRLFKDAIPDSGIKQEYFTGLNRLLANDNISKEEYNNRIK